MNNFILLSKKTTKFFKISDNIILLTFDNGYYMQAINLMMSVKASNKNVSFICICEKLGEDIIRELFNEKYALGIMLYEYKMNFTLSHHRWHDATCFRVFAPWLIDEDDIKEVIYLDADILCKGDLTPLFNLKAPFVMANELDGCCDARSGSLNIYCNAGVVKFNLDTFRQTYSMEDFEDIFFSNLPKLKYLDQDFLNLYIDKIPITKINGFIYNFQPYELWGSHCFDNALRNCRLIHFSWQRPWDPNCRIVGYFDLYINYSFYQPLIKIVEQAKSKSLFHKK